ERQVRGGLPDEGAGNTVAVAAPDLVAGDKVAVEAVVAVHDCAQAAREAVARKRAADAGIGAEHPVAADVRAERSLELVTRLAGDVTDGAVEGGAAVQGVLRALDDLD